ncbi:hypothetical protein IFM89_016044 [Coptis chinensis]|uniref:Uncharacterized protein n=1 Tax=Coptis chinensis TaxID=261450 RepID=A0A835H6P9_9MAGN|nr:hypothetical protein IFM89_016044 [Coptis chinensis]
MVKPAYPPRMPGAIGMLHQSVRPPIPGTVVRLSFLLLLQREKPQTTVYVGKIASICKMTLYSLFSGVGNVPKIQAMKLQEALGFVSLSPPKVVKIVYASPSRINFHPDSKKEVETRYTAYPYIYFAVDDFDSTFDAVVRCLAPSSPLSFPRRSTIFYPFIVVMLLLRNRLMRWVRKRKRTAIPSIFHEEDEDDGDKDKKMRPLVPIDYSTEELQAESKLPVRGHHYIIWLR